jgi:hypothetical protein
MIDTGNSKKMVEKEGPASEREAGPFLLPFENGETGQIT